MKAAVLAASGIDNLAVVDVADPAAPGPGEVLVRLRAASLNYRDLVAVEGGYGRRQRTGGLVLLSDGAGEVVSVGAGVTRFAPGDRVFGLIFPDWQDGGLSAAVMADTLGGTLDGVGCELRLFPERGLVAIPHGLSFVEAATLPVAAITAWSAIVTQGGVAPGDVVLTQGTGGVSLFALQFARLAGAEVIVISSSDAKLERARALGAGHTINYVATPEWSRPARAVTGGRGVDHVVELGGGGTLEQSLRVVRVGGTLSLIGVLGGAAAAVPLGRVVTQNIRLQGVTCGSRREVEAMVRAIALAGLKPAVDRVFPLAEIRAALEWLRAGRHFGKVCIEV
ncbi:MAG: NAD(P)-dependent alcohol dehydrogenase [Alphaproteobacteria bacterium]|nr:NAD(P)-dependent alcohol dehydrogenase [Alphaproteobacteria bacterium]